MSDVRSDPTMNWIRLSGRGTLKTLIDPDGQRGLILRVTDTPEGREVGERALAAGFEARRARGMFTLVVPRGERFPFSIEELNERLGGELVEKRRSELLAPDMVINLQARAKARQEPRPDPATVRSIGLNAMGEEVIQDASQRWVRRPIGDTGETRAVPESAGGQPTAWLRVRRPEDAAGIAGGLLRMAQRGTLHRDDFERIRDAALDGAPEGVGLDRDGFTETLRRAMLRQITSIAIEDGPGFRNALRIGASTDFVLARESDGPDYRPSSGVLSLLRRLVRGHDSVDFRGHPDLAVAMPRLRSTEASLQVHDLSSISPDGRLDHAMNVLSRRPEGGNSVFLLMDTATGEDIDRLRGAIGRAYGLEAVTRIAPAVADGIQAGHGIHAIFVGERRPAPLDALPQAALRSFEVVTSEDLVNLEREVLRSRNRIRDFNRGEVVEQDISAEDDRAENMRQRPYQPLSRAGEPFTMIPIALEGATTRALQRVARDMEDRGGVDAVVAAKLGRSTADLGELLTPEQVDAVGMRINAAERGRGFLLADQTGVGKGRSLAAIARAHLREHPDNRVLYFTESPQINVPDVVRDFQDVEAWRENRPMFLAAGARVMDTVVDPITGDLREKEMKSPPNAERNRIFASGTWPENTNLIITTYSMFNRKEDDPCSDWIARAVDDRTMIILDEAHNALNQRSNTGRNLRAGFASTRPENIVFGTATPMRNPSGINLYEPLLPRTAGGELAGILDNLQQGGEVAQEAVTTMLAEDGVLLRRDHDLSATEFRVDLPDDARMARYQEMMDRFSPMVEAMIDASLQVNDMVGRVQDAHFANLRAQGVDLDAARKQSNTLSQYSLALGAPLSNLARVVMNAMKIDQVVETAVAELAEGRKPLITFHSTNAGLLMERSRGADGNRLDEAALAALPELTLKDQVRRIHDRIYRTKIDGEPRDARDVDPRVAAAAARVEAMIDQLPDGLAASPVDALVERLEAHGMRVGEVSGRTLCYREGRIRMREDRDRRAVIDAFNNGDLEVMIYNSAGATGGSYHASPKFRDQRPRTMIEMETPVDIIKYVQSQGRANRYGQVARPRVVSVMTGLTPEMRILQQRNAKLRALGASVDGNRAHPLLLDDVPDLLNRVGDEATLNVMTSQPALARRMGFVDIANEIEAGRVGVDETVDTGSGTAQSGLQSLANKVLARSIMLLARDQDDLVQRIRMEFDALIEELESRNANPLRPKEFPGQVEILATTLHSGQERDLADIDTSAFLSPLYIATGTHHFTEEAVSAERLIAMVERATTLHGVDGFRPWADRLRQSMPMLLRHVLPEGHDMEVALRQPSAVPGRFAAEHARLNEMADILSNMVPGASMRLAGSDDLFGRTDKVIVDLVPPPHPSFLDISTAYRVRTVSPGMSKPETMALSRLMGRGADELRFRPGLSEGMDAEFLQDFSRMSNLRKRLPVQILQGNVLQAMKVAREHRLGTVSLYRDEQGHVHRGIVVHSNRMDLEKDLPVVIPNGRALAESVAEFVSRARQAPAEAGPRAGLIPGGLMKIWGSMDPEAENAGLRDAGDVMISVTGHSVKIDMIPLRASSHHFYAARPGLYEALHDKPLPSYEDTPVNIFRRAGTNHKYLVRLDLNGEDADRRLYRILTLFDRMPLQTDGRHRALVAEAVARLDRIDAGRAEPHPRVGQDGPADEADARPEPRGREWQDELDM